MQRRILMGVALCSALGVGASVLYGFAAPAAEAAPALKPAVQAAWMLQPPAMFASITPKQAAEAKGRADAAAAAKSAVDALIALLKSKNTPSETGPINALIDGLIAEAAAAALEHLKKSTKTAKAADF